MVACVLGPLLLMWHTQVWFLVPGFSLYQSWILWVFLEMKDIPLSPSLISLSLLIFLFLAPFLSLSYTLPFE